MEVTIVLVGIFVVICLLWQIGDNREKAAQANAATHEALRKKMKKDKRKAQRKHNAMKIAGGDK